MQPLRISNLGALNCSVFQTHTNCKYANQKRPYHEKLSDHCVIQILLINLTFADLCNKIRFGVDQKYKQSDNRPQKLIIPERSNKIIKLTEGNLYHLARKKLRPG